MSTINPENDLFSISKIAELLSAMPGKIERACERGGIRPALRLNGTAYYTESSVEQIRKHLKRPTAAQS